MYLGVFHREKLVSSCQTLMKVDWKKSHAMEDDIYKGECSARNEGESQHEGCPPITLLRNQYQPIAF